MIHIVNGDEFGERLRESPLLNGEVFVWRELYDLGPFSSGWNEKEMAARRAVFLEEILGDSGGSDGNGTTIPRTTLKPAPS